MNSPSADPLAWVHLLDTFWWVVLGVAGAALVLLTLWAYRGHREASRRRIGILVALRLLALAVALLTGGRPSWTVTEKPNVPSRLLIGIDLSRSMTVTDEAGSQARIDFVRKVLAGCQPTLDDLQQRQNCEVVLYAFGPTEFTPADKYDPAAPAAGERSDYAVYLRRVLQEWPNEKYIRGHLVIGDGADNGGGRVDGKPLTPLDAAAEWKRKAPLSTFAVGDQATNQSAKDVAFADVVLDPDPVAVKNKFVLRARVNAFRMAGLTVPLRVEFDTAAGGRYEHQLTVNVTLPKEANNLLEIPIDAPPELPKDDKGNERRQIKVRVEIPVASCPGDTNAANNVVETYLNLTKEGVRVLVVDRLRHEYALLLDALAADKRIDVRKVDLQTDIGGAELLDAFDFDKHAYDVLILGNVTPKQLIAVDPKLPERIAERVTTKGMGFMMTGGHATLNGSVGEGPNEQGWRGVKPIEDILPVTLPPAAPEPENARFMVVPEPRFADSYMAKVADTREQSLVLWDRLNIPENRARFTALNRLTAKPGVNVILWARKTDQLVDLANPQASDRETPLLVGHQIGTDTKGRVLAFAAQDTFLWQYLGIAKTKEGKQIHSRFWRQLVLWLAKQDQEEANAFARPEFPRLRVNDTQGIRVGLRGPNGVVVTEPKFELTVAGPGEKPATPDEQSPWRETTVPVGVGADGQPRAEFVPRTDGEYSVTLKASGKVNDATVDGTATAKFRAVPDVSEEMQRTTPDYELLRSMAAAGGGKFQRVEDLPAFLADLAAQPFETVKPTRKSIPDWRPLTTNAFLPAWMLVFALVLAAEWGLRRWWGLV